MNTTAIETRFYIHTLHTYNYFQIPNITNQQINYANVIDHFKRDKYISLTNILNHHLVGKKEEVAMVTEFNWLYENLIKSTTDFDARHMQNSLFYFNKNLFYLPFTLEESYTQTEKTTILAHIFNNVSLKKFIHRPAHVILNSSRQINTNRFFFPFAFVTRSHILLFPFLGAIKSILNKKIYLNSNQNMISKIDTISNVISISYANFNIKSSNKLIIDGGDEISFFFNAHLLDNKDLSQGETNDVLDVQNKILNCVYAEIIFTCKQYDIDTSTHSSIDDPFFLINWLQLRVCMTSKSQFLVDSYKEKFAISKHQNSQQSTQDNIQHQYPQLPQLLLHFSCTFDTMADDDVGTIWIDFIKKNLNQDVQIEKEWSEELNPCKLKRTLLEVKRIQAKTCFLRQFELNIKLIISSKSLTYYSADKGVYYNTYILTIYFENRRQKIIDVFSDNLWDFDHVLMNMNEHEMNESDSGDTTQPSLLIYIPDSQYITGSRQLVQKQFNSISYLLFLDQQEAPIIPIDIILSISSEVARKRALNRTDVSFSFQKDTYLKEVYTYELEF